MGASRPDPVRSVSRSRVQVTSAALAMLGVIAAAADLAADSTTAQAPARPAATSPAPAATDATPPPVSGGATTAAKPRSTSAPIARTASAARKPVAASTTRKPAVRPASTSAQPVVKVTQPAIPQEERVTYHYNALGRRDPFQALVGGGFIGMDEGGDAPPDVGGIKVVGIVWGATDKFALAEDPRGNSMVLRQGDKVMNGEVEILKRDAIVVKLNSEGATQSITIPVTRKGDKNVQN